MELVEEVELSPVYCSMPAVDRVVVVNGVEVETSVETAETVVSGVVVTSTYVTPSETVVLWAAAEETDRNKAATRVENCIFS